VGWVAIAVVVLFAAGVAVARMRERAWRLRLNRAMHELRRPLQAMALAPASGFRRGHCEPDSLDLALAALEDLDSAVNGVARPLRSRPVAARAMVAAAVERWRGPAAQARRSLLLEWKAGAAVVIADPSRVGQALDNLLANAVEHGGARIRVIGSLCATGVRIVVADHGSGPGGGSRHGADRGHGLTVVREVAAVHGGRFALRSAGPATVAALELPLAPMPVTPTALYRGVRAADRPPPRRGAARPV
jgi:signal transduction histidine kinase